jgi:hypothetical protein
MECGAVKTVPVFIMINTNEFINDYYILDISFKRKVRIKRFTLKEQLNFMAYYRYCLLIKDTRRQVAFLDNEVFPIVLIRKPLILFNKDRESIVKKALEYNKLESNKETKDVNIKNGLKYEDVSNWIIVAAVKLSLSPNDILNLRYDIISEMLKEKQIEDTEMFIDRILTSGNISSEAEYKKKIQERTDLRRVIVVDDRIKEIKKRQEELINKTKGKYNGK